VCDKKREAREQGNVAQQFPFHEILIFACFVPNGFPDRATFIFLGNTVVEKWRILNG
jgi:hypothetical protein